VGWSLAFLMHVSTKYGVAIAVECAPDGYSCKPDIPCSPDR
jgi:hypothetical protein